MTASNSIEKQPNYKHLNGGVRTVMESRRMNHESAVTTLPTKRKCVTK